MWRLGLKIALEIVILVCDVAIVYFVLKALEK